MIWAGRSTSGFIVPNHKLPDFSHGGFGGMTIVNNVDNRGADLGTMVKTASALDRLNLRQYHELVVDRQSRVA